MKVTHYMLRFGASQKIEMAEGALVLEAFLLDGQPWLAMLEPEDGGMKKRLVTIVMLEADTPTSARLELFKYAGPLVQPGMVVLPPRVWHVFVGPTRVMSV